MKKFLLITCALATASSALRADNVALFTVKIGSDKTPRQFAIEFETGQVGHGVTNLESGGEAAEGVKQDDGSNDSTEGVGCFFHKHSSKPAA